MYLRRVIILAIVIIFSYYLGKLHCQKEVVETKVKEIKYVSIMQKKILSQPCVHKPELLDLMRNGDF